MPVAPTVSAFKEEELRAQSQMEEQTRRREEEQARKIAEVKAVPKVEPARPAQTQPVQAQSVQAQPVQTQPELEQESEEDDEAAFEKSKAAFDSEAGKEDAKGTGY